MTRLQDTLVGPALRYLRSNALGALALFLALGGTGYAAAGGFTQGGKIRACVNSEGQLKLVSSRQHCQRGRRAITWGVTGPEGPKGAPGTAGASGATGATGAEGKQGPASLGRGFQATVGFAGEVKTLTEVQSLTLPAGSYIVFAKAYVTLNETSAEALMTCDLNGGGGDDEDELTLTSSGTLSAKSPISLETKATMPTGGGTMKLDCGSKQKLVEMTEVKIDAIEVHA